MRALWVLCLLLAGCASGPGTDVGDAAMDAGDETSAATVNETAGLQAWTQGSCTLTEPDAYTPAIIGAMGQASCDIEGYPTLPYGDLVVNLTWTDLGPTASAASLGVHHDSCRSGNGGCQLGTSSGATGPLSVTITADERGDDDHYVSVRAEGIAADPGFQVEVWFGPAYGLPTDPRGR